MVKLIRLSANDTNIIRNDLQTNVIIKKKSKIALLNLSFEKNKIDYEINNSNNKFQYNIYNFKNDFEAEGGIIDDADLPFILNEDTYKVFLTDFETNLNKSLDIKNPLAVGNKWFVNINSSNYFSIDTFFMLAVNPFNNSYFKQAVEPNTYIINPTNGVFGKDSITTTYDNIWGTNNSKVFFPDVGCGMFRSTIQQVSGAAQGGFYMGLSKLEVNDFSDYNFSKENLVYGVQFTNQTENYKYIDLLSGTIQDAGFVPSGDDIISFESSKGKINIVIYTTADPDGKILSSSDINDDVSGSQLFPCFSFASDKDKLNMKDLILTYDDSIINANDLHPNIPPPPKINNIELTSILPYAGVRNPPIQDDSLRNILFEFNSLTLAQYLGYLGSDNNNILSEASVTTFNNAAINSVTFRDQSEAYLVETLNLKLDSYDGLLQQRKDILMLIQNSRERTENDVLFEANNLIYVDINNDFEFSLRNIDIALKKTNYEKVDVIGELIMTILIKEENEL